MPPKSAQSTPAAAPKPPRVVPANPPPSTTSTTLSSSLSDLSHSLTSLKSSYITNTPARLKLIDSFLAFLVVMGVGLMAYRVGVTSYPFNAFLGSFGGTVGQFILLASLRSQVAPGREAEYGPSTGSNKAAPVVEGVADLGEGKVGSGSGSGSGKVGGRKEGVVGVVRDEVEEREGISEERAFADFCFASVVLHVFMFNFLG